MLAAHRGGTAGSRQVNTGPASTNPLAQDGLDRIEALGEQSKLTLHRVMSEQEDKAWAWPQKHDERAYSLVDSTSFQVMRERRLREAQAFDQDFAAAGFVEFRP